MWLGDKKGLVSLKVGGTVTEDRAKRQERWNGTQCLQVMPDMTLQLESKQEGAKGAKKRKALQVSPQ